MTGLRPWPTSALGASSANVAEGAREAAGLGPGVAHPGRRRRLDGWSRAWVQAMTPVARGRPFDVVLITIGRDGSSGRRRFAHPGQELAIVREGVVRLTLGEDVHRLAVGDAVTFDATTPHRWDHAGGTRVRLLLVSCRIRRHETNDKERTS